MSQHVEIPVRLNAWLRVEDDTVTGIDLCLDTIELDHDDTGRAAFRADVEGSPDLGYDDAAELLESVQPRRQWKVTRVENSDGVVYMDGTL